MEYNDDFTLENTDASYGEPKKLKELINQDANLSQPDQEKSVFQSQQFNSDVITSIIQPMFSDPIIDVFDTNYLVPVVDMFGTPHFVNPMEVDIMSGLPASEFHSIPIQNSNPSFTGEPCESNNKQLLDKANEIEAIRDTAVQHYNEAKAAGNIEEMLRWETMANKQQGLLYDLWNTPTYGLPPKAPGID